MSRSAWLRGGVSLALLALVLWLLPWAEVREAAGRVRPGVWAGAVALFLAGHRLGAVKWRALVNAGRGALPVGDSVRCYAAGLFANLCLPSVIGGDVLRAALAARATGRGEAAVLGGLADRVIDLAVTGVLVAAGALLAGTVVAGWQGQLLGVTGVVGTALAAGALPLLLRRPLRRWPRRLRRPVGRGLVALRYLARTPRATALAVLLSFVVQGGFVLVNAWLGRSVGVDVPLAVWFFAWPLAKVAGMLPVSLGGLGVRDATLAALLVPAGVPAARGVVASLLWQTVLIAGGLLAGAYWWATGLRRRAADDAAAALPLAAQRDG